MMIVRTFSFFCLILLLVGCDPAYIISYQVENSTADSIFVAFQPNLGDDHIIGIASDESVELFDEFGIGMSSRRYLNQLEALPFHVSQIEKGDGVLYNGDPNDFERWDKNATGDTEPSSVLLIVRNEDFN